MKFNIQQIGFDQFQHEIFHILKLFFEEVEVQYTEALSSGTDMQLILDAKADSQNVTVKAQLIDVRSQESWEHQLSRSSAEQENDRKTPLKRAVLSCLLLLLQSATGLEQPWGTLTGVRPAKLMHNLMQRMDLPDIKRMLKDEYLISDSKIELLTEIAQRQLRVIPDLFELDREVSIYIGIPFCPTKCAYCTFPAYDIRGNNGSVSAFLEGLHHEIREIGRWLKEKQLKITTIYWGGGTPTSIEAKEIDALFQTMHESFPSMNEVRELTVEAGRPDTITPEKINVMKKWNVDRISINPQSFTQQTLDTIGRHHTVTETVEKFKLSREMGLENINMDLIIGLPNEGIEQFQHTLDETKKLMPESLTVHTLSFKRASKMTQNREQYEVAQRDEIAEMMKMAEDWTRRHQYVPYYMYRQKNILGNLENVGYSFEGKESLYNILMMEERQTIIGLGCGAVSKVLYPKSVDEQGTEHHKIERFPNPKEPSIYNEAYEQYLQKKLKLLNEAYSETADTFL